MQIKVKRGTDVASKTLAQGELGFATDSNKLYIGTSDGKTVVGPQQWGDIGGSLANQSDLVAVLANKVDEPVNEGTNGQVLTTDGNGGRTWTTVSGGDVVTKITAGSNVTVSPASGTGDVTVSASDNKVQCNELPITSYTQSFYPAGPISASATGYINASDTLKLEVTGGTHSNAVLKIGADSTYINSGELVLGYSGANRTYISRLIPGSVDSDLTFPSNSGIILADSMCNEASMPSSSAAQVNFDSATEKLWVSTAGGGYTLPTASTSTLGGVKVNGSVPVAIAPSTNVGNYFPIIIDSDKKICSNIGTATSSAYGVIKIGTNTTAGSISSPAASGNYYPVQLTSTGQACVRVPSGGGITSHTHGYISYTGTMTDGAGSTANRDAILVRSGSTSEVKTSGMYIDTSDQTTFLRHDGEWAVPSGGGGITNPSYPIITPSGPSSVAIDIDNPGPLYSDNSNLEVYRPLSVMPADSSIDNTHSIYRSTAYTTQHRIGLSCSTNSEFHELRDPEVYNYGNMAGTVTPWMMFEDGSNGENFISATCTEDKGSLTDTSLFENIGVNKITGYTTTEILQGEYVFIPIIFIRTRYGSIPVIAVPKNSFEVGGWDKGYTQGKSPVDGNDDPEPKGGE